MFPPIELFDLLGVSGGLGMSSPLIFAYLDPGSGSLLFQMLIAALLSSMYFFRSTVGSLKNFFSRELSKH